MKDAVNTTMLIADGGYRAPAWKEEHNTSHRKARARVEHAFARMTTWIILRDCTDVGYSPPQGHRRRLHHHHHGRR
ncbi:hypothetical protein Y717_16275, partial [Streptomyces scopuliridis RB72]